MFIFHERATEEKKKNSPSGGCFGSNRYGFIYIKKKNLTLDSKRKGGTVTLFVYIYMYVLCSFYIAFVIVPIVPVLGDHAFRFCSVEVDQSTVNIKYDLSV